MEGEIEMSAVARRSVTILALTLVPALAVGCATAPPPVATYTPQFQFAYPAGEAPASDVTIAIVQPTGGLKLHGGGAINEVTDQTQKNGATFNAAMTAQFQELFNKKGFKQTGPFEDLNSMTFPDKKGADLTITPQVELTVAAPYVNANAQDDLFGTRPRMVFKTVGPCVASGFISFVLLEPLSGEKIWVKKVEIPTTRTDCSGEGTPGHFNAVDNGFAQLLEQTFQLTMRKAWDYLSPEEVTLLKKQSQELRAKKVY
jgi:hypothetical protein